MRGAIFLGMFRRYHVLPLLVWLGVALPSFGQIQVGLRTNQASYIAGEPIFVVVDVKNIGTVPLAYADCFGQANLAVPAAPKKQAPALYGCFSSGDGGSGCGVSKPPILKPAATTSFWYLLKGYRLSPGNYTLQADGRAGIRDAVE